MLEKFDAFQIAKKYYWGCKTLKVAKYLQDQLLRASSSIALNTAEGSGKRTPQDQARFYSMALGSLRECEAILALEQIDDPALKSLGDQLGAILYTLSHRHARTGSRTEHRTETETATETGP
jgi:four helix bundle protein